MKFCIDIQHASALLPPVHDDALKKWAITALTPFRTSGEVTLRLVDPSEMQRLNHQYRKQNKVTNVLAFPATHADHVVLQLPFLGDVILCPEVILEESVGKALDAHWAHLVIHGVLHLLGYDHINEEDAKVMQALEIERLSLLQFPNPYDKEESIEN